MRIEAYGTIDELNSYIGLIRDQEITKEQRAGGWDKWATDLVNPDFAAIARAYGGHGETVLKTEEFAPAFERARASGKPAIIHVKTDAEAISPTTTISKLRGKV